MLYYVVYLNTIYSNTSFRKRKRKWTRPAIPLFNTNSSCLFLSWCVFCFIYSNNMWVWSSVTFPSPIQAVLFVYLDSIFLDICLWFLFSDNPTQPAFLLSQSPILLGLQTWITDNIWESFRYIIDVKILLLK